MTTSSTANVYATVLRDIGKTKGTLDLLLEECVAFNSIVRDESDFAVFLSMPGIDGEKKKSFICSVLGKRFSDDFVNFLCLIIDNERQGDLPGIEFILSALIDEEKNSLRVLVTSGSPLGDLKNKISGALASKYGKEIILEERVDSSLLGGMVLKIGDTVIDGSLSKRLRVIHERLQQCSIEGDAVYEN